MTNTETEWRTVNVIVNKLSVAILSQRMCVCVCVYLREKGIKGERGEGG